MENFGTWQSYKVTTPHGCKSVTNETTPARVQKANEARTKHGKFSKRTVNEARENAKTATLETFGNSEILTPFGTSCPRTQRRANVYQKTHLAPVSNYGQKSGSFGGLKIREFINELRTNPEKIKF